MKRFFFLLATTLLTNGLLASTLNREQAQRRAEALLGKPMQGATLLERRLAPAHRSVALPAYYVFQAADGEGFAIVSAEDEVGDILGYSLHTPSPTAEVPCALRVYLDAFASYVDSYRNGEVEPTEAERSSLLHQAPAVGASAGSYLCATTWGQDEPYNTFCPKMDTGTCPTGCVATAMAQLLYYWHWPVQGQGTGAAQDSNGKTYSGSLAHTYAWDAMRLTTAENKASAEASEAVATLMYDCGLSVNMGYDVNGSSAQSPVKALYTNFGYVPTSLRLHVRDCYTSDEWFALIRNEIDHGRPVYHTAASSTNGGKDASGHAFIADGYDGSGRLHINWGWDGHYDGFYATDQMNPGGYKFVLRQSVTTGITPARNGETGLPTEFPYFGVPPACSYTSGSISKSATFDIALSNLQNLNANAHSWQFTIGLFDVNNTMLADVKSGRVGTVDLPAGTLYTNTFATITCKLTGSYPAGDYALRIVFHETGDKEWLLPDMVGGITSNAVYIRLKGTKIEFTDGSDYIATAIHDLTPFAPSSLSSSPTLPLYFDLSGRSLPTAPTRGTFIVRDGEKVRKVVR